MWRYSRVCFFIQPAERQGFRRIDVARQSKGISYEEKPYLSGFVHYLSDYLGGKPDPKSYFETALSETREDRTIRWPGRGVNALIYSFAIWTANMSRPLRIKYERVVYQVTVREKARRKIYGDDSDRGHFLTLLIDEPDPIDQMEQVDCEW